MDMTIELVGNYSIGQEILVPVSYGKKRTNVIATIIDIRMTNGHHPERVNEKWKMQSICVSIRGCPIDFSVSINTPDGELAVSQFTRQDRELFNGMTAWLESIGLATWKRK